MGDSPSFHVVPLGSSWLEETRSKGVPRAKQWAFFPWYLCGVGAMGHGNEGRVQDMSYDQA